MAPLLDQYLVFRVRSKRDAEAYARLYDRYAAAIYRFAFLKLSSRERAEDVTSETFLRAWEYVLTHEQIANIRALFYSIARNLIIDAYRRAKTQPVPLDDVVTFDPRQASTYVEGTSPNPSDAKLSDRKRGQQTIEASADVALLLERMSRLKEDFRDVLTLRLVEELAFSDIAAILEKTSGNVRVIYHRAIKALEELE